MEMRKMTLGVQGMFLCGANDLITIFVAPECFSLCSYLLSGYTKKDVRSNEATTKYLLMGGASSSILVHGFSWLYGSSGGEIEHLGWKAWHARLHGQLKCPGRDTLARRHGMPRVKQRMACHLNGEAWHAKSEIEGA
ncbi:hypothetical protein AHAS_Ahas06G0182000 [Arachis hypogaea]